MPRLVLPLCLIMLVSYGATLPSKHTMTTVDNVTGNLSVRGFAPPPPRPPPPPPLFPRPSSPGPIIPNPEPPEPPQQCSNGNTPNTMCGVAVDPCECKCLAGDGLVQLAGNGGSRRVSELKSGDIVLAMNVAGQVVSSEIMMISHSSAITQTLFTVIWTEHNEKIALSPRHLIPIMGKDGSSFQFVFAETIEHGDYIYMRSELGNKVTTARVVKVEMEAKQGYFSPITIDGTIIVNNVVASCYALINDHHLAHIGLAPLRWSHAILKFLSPNAHPFGKPMTTFDDNQLPWYMTVLLGTAHKFLPQLFDINWHHDIINETP